MVQKITIGICGAEAKCGCTHMSLLIGNFLTSRGYKTALIECNGSGAFEDIRSGIGQGIHDNGYFLLNRIHFYPVLNAGILRNIMNSDYSFMVYDFGDFKSADKMMLAKCDIPIIICGSKPWETAALYNIFEEIEEQHLKDYNFYFNFCSENIQSQEDIRAGMGVLKNIYFPPYKENPFNQEAFPGAEVLLAGVFEKQEKEKPTKTRKPLIPFNLKKQNKDEQQITAKKEKKVEEKVLAHETLESVSDTAENSIESETAEVETVSKSKPERRNLLHLTNTLTESIVDTFAGFASQNEKKNQEPEIEADTTCKNLSYTLQDSKKVLADSMDALKGIKQIMDSPDNAVESENMDMVQMLAYSIFRNAYCSVIRAGVSPRRTNARDGSPLLLLPANNKEIACSEADVQKIFGKEMSIVKPFEDTYVEV